MTTNDFYRSFEVYRAEVAPGRREVQGTLTGPGGDPPRQWDIRIEAYQHGSGSAFDRADATDTRFDGSVLLRLQDGTHDLFLEVRCGPGGGFPKLGWHSEEGGVVAEQTLATPIVVAGTDIAGIAIRVPAEPSDLDSWCDFGPRRAVRGTVVGPNGEPLRGVRVDAFTGGQEPSGAQDKVLTNLHGEFVLHLPDGIYTIAPLLFIESGTAWLTLWDDRYAVGPKSVPVEGADVSGVRIQILKGDIHPTHLE